MRVEIDVDNVRENIMRELNDGLIGSMHGMIINPSICAGKAESMIELLESCGALSINSKERTRLRELKSKIFGR